MTVIVMAALTVAIMARAGVVMALDGAMAPDGVVTGQAGDMAAHTVMDSSRRANPRRRHRFRNKCRGHRGSPEKWVEKNPARVPGFFWMMDYLPMAERMHWR